MNREDFIHLVNEPNQVSMQDTETLEELVKIFPFCQLGHMFIAKAHMQEGSMLSNQKVKRAAVYAVSREKLKPLLEERTAVTQHTAATQALEKPDTQPLIDQEEKNTPLHAEKPVTTITDAQSSLDQPAEYTLPDTDEAPSVLNENVNTGQEETGKAENISKKNRQFEIIDSFIKAQPRIMPVSPAQKEETNNRDLSETSHALPVSIASENLAKIMIKQGKTDKAIKIYEQLILKNPEKKSYFASQIENLKK